MTALCSSKLQAHWSPRPDLAKFDTAQAQEIAGGYGIGSSPAVILCSSGREFDRTVGAMELSRLLMWARSVVAKISSN